MLLTCICLIGKKKHTEENICGRCFVESNVQHVAVSVELYIYCGLVGIKLIVSPKYHFLSLFHYVSVCIFWGVVYFVFIV